MNETLESEKYALQLREKMTERQNQRKAAEKLNRSVSKTDPLVITFAGKFKTGKSSLINALLGIDILPTKATTATAVVTRIMKGSKIRAWQIEKGCKKEITVEKAKDIILHQQVKDINNLVEILFELPVNWLSPKIEIRDTPGMDDSAQNGILEEVTMHSLADTDICVCVYDAATFISGKEKERTEKIYRRLSGNVVYAINCINRLNSQKNLDLVRSKAESCFKSMKYPNKMGRRFMISSLPGNIYMDGFEVWFKTITSVSNSSFFETSRKISAAGQMKALCESQLEERETDDMILNEYISSVRKLHDEKLSELKKKSAQEAKEKADYINYNIAPAALDKFTNISGLETKLKKIFQDSTEMAKYDSYPNMCKNVTRDFFKDRYQEICSKWPSVYKYKDNKFVTSSLSPLSFPDKNYISVSASTGEKVGGAGLGAGIGFLIGGPIGALIGGAFGGAVGGADSKKDNSIANTMSFIRKTVIPAMRSALEKHTRKYSDTYKTEINKNISACVSGYEKQLESLEMLEKDLAEEKNILKGI